MSLPHLQIEHCGQNAAPQSAIGQFSQSSGDEAMSSETGIALCWDDAYLRVEYAFSDDPACSTFTECNDPLYDQTVGEIFVCGGDFEGDAPSTYLEVEISPADVLWVGTIFNPTFLQPNVTTNIDCDESGIVHSVEEGVPAGGWTGKMAIPWELIPGIDGAAGVAAGQELRLNLLRILMAPDNCGQDCDETCEYGAWSPTQVTPPAFHRSAFFGSATLLQGVADEGGGQDGLPHGVPPVCRRLRDERKDAGVVPGHLPLRRVCHLRVARGGPVPQVPQPANAERVVAVGTHVRALRAAGNLAGFSQSVRVAHLELRLRLHRPGSWFHALLPRP
jgi:hypothetical protein